MFFVITNSAGRVDRINDEIQNYAIYASRRHAMRVIHWLGLTDRIIREASQDEIDSGMFCTAHNTPNWRAGDSIPRKTVSQCIAAKMPIHGRNDYGLRIV